MKFYVFVWSFFGGVFLGSVWGWPFTATLFFLLVFLAIFFIFYFSQNSDAVFQAKSGKNHLLIVLIIIPSVLFGISRMGLAKLHNGDPALDRNIDKKTLIRGLIVAEPDERETGVNLTIRLDKSKTKVLVRAGVGSDFQYGDLIEAEGMLKLPEKIEAEDGGRAFDYPNYLAKDGILYILEKPQVRLISEGDGSSIKRRLFQLKRAFMRNLHLSLPEPESGFLSAITVAGKRSLASDLLLDTRRAGVVQIVVLSGYHLSVVATGIMKFLSFLPRPAAIGGGALGIILFAIMTGGASAIVRAAIMALISLLAEATHRKYDGARALIMAGFLMVLANPRILLYDPSFQLSFLATLGIIVLSPYFEKKLPLIPEKLGLRGNISITLAAQVFVLPLLMFQTGHLSLVGTPANILVVMPIPVTMFLGFLAGFLGFINHLIVLPFSFLLYFLLSYEIFIIRFFAYLPFAYLGVPFPLWLLALIYGIYIWIYFRRMPFVDKNGRAAEGRPAILTDFSAIKDIKIIED